MPNLGGWDLWNPDEPRYAEIAREMLTTHQWVIPHLNGEVYYDKPPLFFAMIAGTSKVLGGLDERAARLPSAIFGLLTLLLVYILGKEMADERTGLLGALVLASSGQYFWLSRRANIDATLTFTTTLTILLFMLGYQRDKGRILLYLLAYLSMAAGVLVKLQPAVIVPALALGSYYLWRKERRFFLDPSHLPGILLFAAVIGGWLLLAQREGGIEYLKGLLFEKTALTFFKTPGHDRPIYYYLYNFPGQFLPWSIFLPSAIIYALKRGEKAMALPLLWFATIFLFFSLAEAKRGLYLLPLYPAAALMVGHLWAREGLSGQGRKLLGIPLGLASGLLLLSGLALPFPLAKFGGRYLQGALGMGIVMGTILLGGGLLLLVSLRRRRALVAFGTLFLTAFCLYLFGVFKVLPAINPYKSARPLSEKVLEAMGPGDRLAVYRFQGAEFNFYTGIVPILRVYRPERLKALLEEPGRTLCIVKERDFRRLEEDLGMMVEVIARGRVGHKKLVLIRDKE